MIIHLQHGNVALACLYLISLYLSHSVFGGEFDHQVISWCYGLPWVKGKLAQDGVVGGRAIDNQEGDILGNLLRVIIDRYGQGDWTEGVYFCSSKSDKWCIC